jgi:hypothetical protein
MSLRFYALNVDCRDPKTLADWWATALGWEITYNEDDEYIVVEPPHHLDESRAIAVGERLPGLSFIGVPEPKTLKNRLHMDLAPGPGDDQQAEVGRLEALGARRVDVGQGPEVSWVVMADPEGNEFCILSSRGND